MRNSLLQTHVENNESKFLELENVSFEDLSSELKEINKIIKSSNLLNKDLYALENLEDVIADVKDIVEQQNINLSEVKEENDIPEEEPTQDNPEGESGSDSSSDSGEQSGEGSSDAGSEGGDAGEGSDSDYSLDDGGDSGQSSDGSDSSQEGESSTDQSAEGGENSTDNSCGDSGDSSGEENKPGNDSGEDKQPEQDKSKDANKEESKEDSKTDENIAQETLRLYSCLGKLGIPVTLNKVDTDYLYSSLGVKPKRYSMESHLSKKEQNRLKYRAHHESFMDVLGTLGSAVKTSIKFIIEKVIEFYRYIKSKLFQIAKVTTVAEKEIKEYLKTMTFKDEKGEEFDIRATKIDGHHLNKDGKFDLNFLENINYDVLSNNQEIFMDSFTNQSRFEIDDNKYFFEMWFEEMCLGSNGKPSLQKINYSRDTEDKPVYFLGKNSGYTIFKEYQEFEVGKVYTVFDARSFKPGNLTMSLEEILNKMLFAFENMNQIVISSKMKKRIDGIIKALEDLLVKSGYSKKSGYGLALGILHDCQNNIFNAVKSYQWLKKNMKEIANK